MKLFDSFVKDKNGETKNNNLGCSIGLTLFLAGPTLVVAVINFVLNPGKYWYHLLAALFLVFALALLFYRVSTRSIFKRAQYTKKNNETLECEFKDVTDNKTDEIKSLDSGDK